MKNLPQDTSVTDSKHGRMVENRFGQWTVFFDVMVPPGEWRVNVAMQVPFKPITVDVTENDSLVVHEFIIGLLIQEAFRGGTAPRKRGRPCEFDTAQTGQYASFRVDNRTKSPAPFQAAVHGRIATWHHGG